jgi:lysine/ornithine N-monooxygenase
LYKVKGYSLNKETDRIETFNYLTRNLVLATGSSNLPNVLNVKGEDLPFVLHSLNDLEHLIASGHLNQNSDPIMVVGAGLSAADAVIAARFHSVPGKCIH